MADNDAFYNELVTEVNNAITEYGKTFVVNTPGEYDPLTMTTTPPASRDVVGVVSSGRDLLGLGLSSVDTTKINWAAQKFILLQPAANIEVGESIIIDGRDMQMSEFETVKPADIVCLYIVQVVL